MSAASDHLSQDDSRSFEIRAMTVADVPAVGALEKASYPYPWSEGIFRDCLRVGYACRVAVIGERIVGYGVAAIGTLEAHILNLCVSEDLRGRGLGRQMLCLLLDRAGERGATEVFLEVRPTNALAISLYQSVGFIPVGTRKAYYQAKHGREDALVLKLDLRSEGPSVPVI